MTLSDDYVRYPHRRYGIDNDRYDWSILPRRDSVTWPGGAKVALWIVPVLEYFPMNTPKEPFVAPGGSTIPYPDPRLYSSRDYGSRVGAFRVFKSLDKHGLKASVAFNSAVAARYPFLLNEVTRRGWEVMSHGVDMSKLHHGELDIERNAATSGKRSRLFVRCPASRSPAGSPLHGRNPPTRSTWSRRKGSSMSSFGSTTICLIR